MINLLFLIFHSSHLAELPIFSGRIVCIASPMLHPDAGTLSWAPRLASQHLDLPCKTVPPTLVFRHFHRVLVQIHFQQNLCPISLDRTPRLPWVWLLHTCMLGSLSRALPPASTVCSQSRPHGLMLPPQLLDKYSYPQTQHSSFLADFFLNIPEKTPNDSAT